MRFDRRTSSRSYFDRRTQLRMLGLVLGLGLVLLAMRVMGRAEFWRGIFPDEQPVAESESAPERELGEFRAPSEEDRAEREEPEAEAEADAEPPAERRFPPGDEVDLHVEAELLEAVRDSPGIREDEADAYYTLLAKADRAPLAELERLADETPPQSVLMHNPAYYRGRLVTIEGDLKRLVPLEVSERMQDRYGVDRLWDAWIATPDSPRRPLHVYLTDVPESLPTGKEIDRRVPVRVAAYFFKIEAYQGRNGLTRTPMLLGKRPRHLPPSPTVAESDALVPYVVGFATIVAATLGGLLWWYARGDRRFADAHVRSFVTAPEGAIESLSDLETTDPSDTLRELSERDRASDAE